MKSRRMPNTRWASPLPDYSQHNTHVQPVLLYTVDVIKLVLKRHSQNSRSYFDPSCVQQHCAWTCSRSLSKVVRTANYHRTTNVSTSLSTFSKGSLASSGALLTSCVLCWKRFNSAEEAEVLSGGVRAVRPASCSSFPGADGQDRPQQEIRAGETRFCSNACGVWRELERGAVGGIWESLLQTSEREKVVTLSLWDMNSLNSFISFHSWWI